MEHQSTPLCNDVSIVIVMCNTVVTLTIMLTDTKIIHLCGVKKGFVLLRQCNERLFFFLPFVVVKQRHGYMLIPSGTDVVQNDNRVYVSFCCHY